MAAIVDIGDDLHAALDAVVHALGRPGLRGAALALIDSEELFIAAYSGELDDAARNARMPLGIGIVGTVALTGIPAVCHDLDAPVGGVLPANRRIGTNVRIRSMVCVPLRVAGKVVGILEVDSAVPGSFTQADVSTMLEVAEVLGPAVRHITPLRVANERLRRRVREMSVLTTTSRSLGASLDLGEVLSAAVAAVTGGMAVAVALLLRRDPGGLRLAAARVHDVTAVPDEPPLLPAASVAPLLDALATPTVTVLEGLPARDGFSAWLGDLDLPHAVAAPMHILGGDADALLVAVSESAHRFDEDETRVLAGIADVVALAVANAERYRALATAAATDPLTGLPNASAFERALATAPAGDLAVVALDLDRFRRINDEAGYQAGDEALRRVAAALREVTIGRGVLARTGGDEFAVLLEGADAVAAADVAERLRRALEGVVLPAGLCRATVGVASGRASAPGEARRVWWWATEALEVSRLGVGNVDGGAGAGSARVVRPRRWEQSIDRILVEHAIDSVFQPVVRMADGAVVGYEALARPRGADASQSVEGLFAAAQRRGEARTIDWLSRRAALNEARRLPAGTTLFLNVGVWALLDPLHDVDQMLLLCRWAERSPQEVVLEITERELITDVGRLAEVLASYRDAGFRFAIDDLGEGHSTLEVLASAQPEYIKVARSLIQAGSRPGARAAIGAVVAFARSTDARVIAEGIESAGDVAFCGAVGITLGQGWWLGRPVRMGRHAERPRIVSSRAGDDQPSPSGAHPMQAVG